MLTRLVRDVIDQQTGNPADVDPQINGRILEDIFRCAHHPKQRLHAQDSADGEQQTQEEGRGDGSLHRLVELFHLLRAVKLPDGHNRTGGEAVEEKDQHVDDHRRGADGRQSLLAHEVPHNDRVHRIVQHLEDIAEHERQCKGDQLPHNRAAGHVDGC